MSYYIFHIFRRGLKEVSFLRLLQVRFLVRGLSLRLRLGFYWLFRVVLLVLWFLFVSCCDLDLPPFLLG